MAKALGLRVKDGTRIGPLSPAALADLGLSALQNLLSYSAGARRPLIGYTRNPHPRIMMYTHFVNTR